MFDFLKRRHAKPAPAPATAPRKARAVGTPGAPAPGSPKTRRAPAGDPVTRRTPAAPTQVAGERAEPAQPLTISDENELAEKIRFSHPLFKELELVQSIAAKVCPIMLESNQVVLLCLPEFLDSDIATEVEERIGRKLQKQMWSPARVVVNQPSLLMSIIRGHIDKEKLSNRRKVMASPERIMIMRIFEDLIRWGVKHNAADIHLNVFDEKPYSEIRFTVGGKYVAVDQFAKMPTQQMQELLRVAYLEIKGAAQSAFDPQKEQQGRSLHTLDGGKRVMLRWATLAADAGVSVTQRILHLDVEQKATTFEQLGYLPSHIRMMNRARVTSGGAVVIAGIVGSGKSTTLATWMRQIPPYRKIITFEDPVEYITPNAIQNTITRLNDGEDPFEEKLRAAKRSAMHDLMIGEIRDLITGRAFMDLSASGTNLYTTTHAGSAVQIPDRLASEVIGVSRDFLASSGVLKLMVYQGLIPKLCECRHDFEFLIKEGGTDAEGLVRGADYWEGYADRIDKLYRLDTRKHVKVRNPEGCPICRKQGFSELFGLNDRTVVAEMVEPGIDEVALEMIRRADNVALTRHYFGHTDLDYTSEDMTGKSAMDCAIYKAYKGEIDPREIEPRFKAFETVEVTRALERRRKS